MPAFNLKIAAMKFVLHLAQTKPIVALVERFVQAAQLAAVDFALIYRTATLIVEAVVINVLLVKSVAMDLALILFLPLRIVDNAAQLVHLALIAAVEFALLVLALVPLDKSFVIPLAFPWETISVEAAQMLVLFPKHVVQMNALTRQVMN